MYKPSLKLKLKANAELLIIGISYFDHQMRFSQDSKSKINVDKNESEATFILENEVLIEQLNVILNSIVEIPELEFSKPETWREYYRRALYNIRRIEADYLNESRNNLNDSEKNEIVKALKIFYYDTVHKNCLFPPPYGATKLDRIGYFVCFYALASFAVVAITNLSNPIKSAQVPEVISKEPNIGVQNENKLVNLDEFLQILADLDSLDEIVTQGNTESIRRIYAELDNLLPALSQHRKTILVGYIALNFGYINEEDYHHPNTNYGSFNSFLNARVKGLLNQSKKKP